MNRTHASTIAGWLDSFLESPAVFAYFDFITEFSSVTHSSLILCLSEFNGSKSYRTSACTVLSTFSCSSSCSSCKKFSNLFDIFKLLRAIIWKRELDSQFVNAHDRWFNPYYSDSRVTELLVSKYGYRPLLNSNSIVPRPVCSCPYFVTC